MKQNRSLLAVALTLLVGACAPVTSYSDAEAPKQLKLDSATTQLDLRFVPGSATLSATDAARLRQLAATGRVGPSDRVIIAAAGGTELANQRLGAVSSQLQRYGVVPIVGSQAVPPDRAIVAVTRTLVTLPPCPNWSKLPYSDFENQASSNFGCANETNLGMMVAHPSDLASGLPVGAPAAEPAVRAVNRYLNDKVELPTAAGVSPIAAPTSGGQQGGGGQGAGQGTGGG